MLKLIKAVEDPGRFLNGRSKKAHFGVASSLGMRVATVGKDGRIFLFTKANRFKGRDSEFERVVRVFNELGLYTKPLKLEETSEGRTTDTPPDEMTAPKLDLLAHRID